MKVISACLFHFTAYKQIHTSSSAVKMKEETMDENFRNMRLLEATVELILFFWEVRAGEEEKRRAFTSKMLTQSKPVKIYAISK